MTDPILIAKIAGAILALAVGIWVGLGMPGLRQRPQSREWRSADRLRATWINRMFFRMDGPSRRFDAGRLIVPKSKAESTVKERDEGDDDPASEIVSLRRPGS
jgi:hypothetical protein